MAGKAALSSRNTPSGVDEALVKSVNGAA